MADTGLLLAAAAGLVVGGLYYAKKKADAAGSGAGSGTSACDAITNPYGYAICKGAGIVNNFLNELRDWDKAADAENKKLNGEVKTPLEVGKYSYCAGSEGGTPGNLNAGGASSPTRPMLWGTAQEFKNGCQPFKNAPGWAKCVAGTKDMTTPNCPGNMRGNTFNAAKLRADGKNYEGGTEDKFATAVLTGRAGDPTTFGPFIHPTTGEGWAYILGEKKTCPAGQVPDKDSVAFVRDHIKGTTTAIVKCHAPGEPVTFGAAGNTLPGDLDPSTWTSGDTSGGHVQINIGGSPGNPPPGFHWVASVPGNPGHWERDMAPR